jgi:hypothetical protein
MKDVGYPCGLTALREKVGDPLHLSIGELHSSPRNLH